MTKHLLFTIAVSLMTCMVTAQSWTIRCRDLNAFEYTEFEDGFIDNQGVAFLAGRSGDDHEQSKAYLMRIDSDGTPSTIRYEEGVCSCLNSIIEYDEGRIFAAGNLSDENEDFIFTMFLDKNLNVLSTCRYAKEQNGNRFGRCTAIPDGEGHIVVASSLEKEYSFLIESKGVLLKYNDENIPILSRYLIADYPDPFYYMNRFKVRQMWFNNDDNTFLCLVPGTDGIYSFITFDTDFNLLEERPIQDEMSDILGHTLSDDCYTDLWKSDEAIVFSSLGWFDHNKLRVMKINTDGDFLDFIHFNERGDTIDNVSLYHCMAAANDTTLFFSTDYSIYPAYPGTANIYLLNDRLEIIGNHLDDKDESLRSSIILASPDGGCISVYDSCSYQYNCSDSYPIISKLSREDFHCIPWSIKNHETPNLSSLDVYPNPTDGILYIPFDTFDGRHSRCQIKDMAGRTLLDCLLDTNTGTLQIDVSSLNKGLYNYVIYNNKNIITKGTFIKN